jgi:3-hydroxybutyryl-CoA dehydrogenase
MINKIGVIGAGQMGSGIAHVAALCGCDVVITDVSAEVAEKGIALIGTNMGRQVARAKITQAEADKSLARITAGSDAESFSLCQLVIEAASENEALKIKILKDLCQHLPDETLIATNTSSISITKLAAATDRPDRFMGMHFMYPVPVMQLVELIRGIATSEETFEAIKALAEGMGKTVAVSEDFPGFLANRILMPMINEAIFALYEGVGTVEAIDTTMRLGANHPMGPLSLADLIGLDICLAIMQVLHTGMADSKYRPCPLLVKYVEAGWLGRKSGRGFYDYSGGGDPIPTR